MSGVLGHNDDLFSVLSFLLPENELTKRIPKRPPYMVLFMGEEVIAQVPVLQPIKYQ